MDQDWRKSASCRGANHEIFEIIDEDHPRYTIDSEENTRISNENAEKALEYCRHCPVRGQCLESASPEELKYTIRGGQLPIDPRVDRNERRRIQRMERALLEGRAPGRRGRPKGSKTRVKKPNPAWFKKQNCPQGHKLPIPNGDCFKCDRNKRAYERARIRNIAKLMG